MAIEIERPPVTMPTHDDEADMPYVFVQQVSCPNPRCQSFRDLHVYKTCPEEADRSLMRYVRCGKCGQRFKLVVEVDESLQDGSSPDDGA